MIYRKKQFIILFIFFEILLANCCSWASQKRSSITSTDWVNKGYFKLGAAKSGKSIFLDPNGKPFFSKGMVYAYSPERGPLKNDFNAEQAIEDLAIIKRHGFNTLNLYGDLYLEKILSWCDKNEMAVYFRTNYTSYLTDFPQQLSEFPDFMDPQFRKMAKDFYLNFLNIIKGYHCVLAIDMDQRWLFDIDWSGEKRYGLPKLNSRSLAYLPKWLGEKYKDIGKLNQLWKKGYKDFDEILRDSEIVKDGVVQDLDRALWRVDIVEYTLWTINDFLKELTDYMRTIDSYHLITYTTELPEVIPFPISTRANSGIDFISPVHYNSSPDFYRDWIGNGELIYMTKWHNDLYNMPVYISETGFRTSPLDSNPPNMSYAAAEIGNENHAAELYLRQTCLMNAYPWFLGWSYFKLYDKIVEGDFGYLRDDRSLKPISKLGQYVNSMFSINMAKEKEPLVWIYYPEYALASTHPSYQQYKSLVLILENKFLEKYEQIMEKALGYIGTVNSVKEAEKMEVLKDLFITFNMNWLPFAFTSEIPKDNKPIILAGMALEQLSLSDRNKLAEKRTITIGQIGLTDERYNETEPWYAKIIGIRPQDYAQETMHVSLASLFNNDGISYPANKRDGNFNGKGNTFNASSLPSDKKVFFCQEDGLNFLFPDKSDGKLNNVECNGQIIDVEENIYTSVHFLLTSHEGDICEKITLGYSDGTEESMYLSKTITDWRYMPFFGHVAVYSLYYNDPAKEDYSCSPAYLTHVFVPCRAEKALKSIKLPVSAQIHIFSISLVKGGMVKNEQVSVAMEDITCSGKSSWVLLVNKEEGASYKVLATFDTGKPAIVQTRDGRHTAFLYDPLTWAGKEEEISKEVTGHAKILRKILSTYNLQE